MNRISPTNDLAFKKVLASEENKDILGGLINDFFDVVAEEIVIENPYSIEAYIEHVKGQRGSWAGRPFVYTESMPGHRLHEFREGGDGSGACIRERACDT